MKQLTAASAQRAIRARAATGSQVTLTLHATEQMAARDILLAEVFRILREGHVRETPVLDGDEWKAIIELQMPQGGEAASVTVLAATGGLVVVTVMWRE